MARPVFENTSLMLTRRCRGQTFLLSPREETDQIIRYVVAVMAQRWNIDLHALMVMSNHWHPCLTDNDAKIVDFQRDCHNFIARALNVTYGDSENMWAGSQQSSRVECTDGKALLKQIAYAMANPVEACLVRYGHSWPGVRHAWPCKPLVIKRPPRFFRSMEDGGTWPDEVVLELKRPPGFEELSDEELAKVIKAAIFEREEKFRRQYDAEGRRFLGRRAIRRQSRYSSPRTRASRSGISPKVSSGDRWRRQERLNANKRWLAAYREALPRWRAGDRDVVFPAGTYKMRVVHGVPCAAEPFA